MHMMQHIRSNLYKESDSVVVTEGAQSVGSMMRMMGAWPTNHSPNACQNGRSSRTTKCHRLHYIQYGGH